MKEQNFGTGHGMPAPISEEASQRRMAEETAKRKKQTEEFANNSLPTTKTESVTIHESKHFPFQIVEITISDNEKSNEQKLFKIGTCGQIVSDKTFADKEKAEKYISSRPWELITNLMCVTIQNAIKYEKSSKK